MNSLARKIAIARQTLLALGFVVSGAAVNVAAAAPTETILYSFALNGGGNAPKGAYATPGVVSDAAGNLYGTTQVGGAKGFGVVFEASPPPSGKTKWTFKDLYSFKGGKDGAYATPGLIIDPVTKVLYGQTTGGGGPQCNGYGCGVVYEMVPPVPPAKAWKEVVIHRFTGFVTGGGDGEQPWKYLVEDASGNLYGTAQFGGKTNDGIVFELSPPPPPVTKNSTWTENILYSFCYSCAGGYYPEAGLARDPLTGVLYGTTYSGSSAGAGAVFKLTPPNGVGSWTLTELHPFGQAADGGFTKESVVLTPAGNLIGTSPGGGANFSGHVFQLSPPSGGGTNWNKTVLYSFCSQANCTDGGYPEGQLHYDAPTGAIYGTTQFGGQVCTGCGALFKLTPAGGGTYTESVLHNFGGATDGSFINSGEELVVDGSGHVFGTTGKGGKGGYGTIFEIAQ